LTPNPPPLPDFRSGPATLIDIEARLQILSHIKLALGADNLFDKYPDNYPPYLNANGNANFPNYSPFGRAGRFVYAKLGYEF